jgi:hypothetical protein
VVVLGGVKGVLRRKFLFNGKIYLTGKGYPAELDSRLDQFPSTGTITAALSASDESLWAKLVVPSKL